MTNNNDIHLLTKKNLFEQYFDKKLTCFKGIINNIIMIFCYLLNLLKK